MSYVVDLLKLKRVEYNNLLDHVNNQFEQGDVFRSRAEFDSAKGAKKYYEDVIKDIDEKLEAIENERSLITLTHEEWAQAKIWLTELAESQQENSYLAMHPVLRNFFLEQEKAIRDFVAGKK